MRRDPRNACPQLEYQQVNRAKRDRTRVEIGLLEKTERRYYCAVSLPNILSLGKLWQLVPPSDSMYPTDLSEREWPASDTIMNH